MNVVAIIPARGGSKSIPGKNIMDFCGKPLIAWSILQAGSSCCVKEIYVTSDSSEILSVSESYGASAIERPAELSSDTASSEDALIHALGNIKTADKIDLVVFLQATSPLRYLSDIDNAVEKLIKAGADSLFSSAKLDDFLIWEEKDGIYRSFNYDYRNRGRRQDRKAQYVENGSIYVFKPEILFEYKNRLGGKISTYGMEFWQAWEIDNMENEEICEWYFIRKLLDSCRDIKTRRKG
ncbi:MAG: acylneuraminate cytidylyltransferase family protein [Elusimicrobia bacterium]|nr:acylneuraminate cytidylyltransferase family protein [Elusimicrobiota bacterium]